MEQLPFIPNQLYKRSIIHDQFGGNRQSGISPSTRYPYIFIFSGKTGQQYGYQDGWDNPYVFTYSGEGQVGDMKFTKGNLALKEHLNLGKRVFLFEYERVGYVKFISELEYYDSDYLETIDINGDMRLGIKFFFKRKGAVIPYAADKLNVATIAAEPQPFLAYTIPNKTERSGLVTSRVGQGAYRKRLLHRWEYKCAVTGFDQLQVLIASHILPWSKSNDFERLDIHNGLLLSPVYDALFDKGFISFNDDGEIILSDKIRTDAYQKIGITGKEKIKNLNEGNIEYLRRHWDLIL